MKLVWLVAVVASGLMGRGSAAPSPWEQPAAALAEEIAGILGPGQARLTIRNLSTIPSDEIPAIRLLLEQDLKGHGVLASGVESANTIRVTLSENLRERFGWPRSSKATKRAWRWCTWSRALRNPRSLSYAGLDAAETGVLTTRELYPSQPVLAALETKTGRPGCCGAGGDRDLRPDSRGLREQKRVEVGLARALARDPRGIDAGAPKTAMALIAFVPEWPAAAATLPAQKQRGEWTVSCRESDDPWPIFGDHPQSGSSRP
jgi:hypothetical protein